MANDNDKTGEKTALIGNNDEVNRSQTNEEPPGSPHSSEINPLVLEEWKELRAEISRKQGAAEKLVLGASGGNLAIMAFALKDATTEGILIALLPTVVTSIAYLWFLSYLYSGFRIAVYLQSKVEPLMPALGWEKWLSELRDEHKIPIDPFRMICWTFYLVSLVTAIIKLFLIKSWPAEINAILLQSGIIIFAWSLWIAIFHGIIARRIRGRIKLLYSAFQ